MFTHRRSECYRPHSTDSVEKVEAFTESEFLRRGSREEFDALRIAPLKVI